MELSKYFYTFIAFYTCRQGLIGVQSYLNIVYIIEIEEVQTRQLTQWFYIQYIADHTVHQTDKAMSI